MTGSAGSRLDAAPASGVSELADVRVPVPPSQPGPAGGGGWPLLSDFGYGPLGVTVPIARARTKAVLAEWEITPGDLVLGDIAVVVSELVSNAVVASRALPWLAEIRVWLCCDRVRLLVEVGDQSLDPPLLVSPDDEALSGRGLRVVEGLSSGWGWFPATGYGLAKVVWAEMRLPSVAVDGLAAGEPQLCRSAG